jgi:ubiquinone/menaquinone biosynthesis C-methylase UbiE
MTSSPLKDMERDHWHDHASYYEELAGPITKEPAAKLLDAVGARSGTRLLDVCCGPGYGAGQRQSVVSILSASIFLPR